MGEAKRRGTFQQRRAHPQGNVYREVSEKAVDVAETSVITRQMTRRFGFRKSKVSAAV